ncbi:MULTISPECIES: ribonucleotide-diphosphate reductase subunit beta [Thermus]|uniref:ribonucleoside-diphosphate reductase n=1 Tax=Thermus brockianus TaxID=56956 RepID=A0A1J0LXR7_THEBO|nr:ribonucleotide-diphosphate reductase subunit beta [Thermus brockianus]APD10395.1 ribonucleoside-diphosphate reductase, beta subunit [Thermus brockianus]BDG17673.1 ribonucleotide reductase [Thermus brockianus]
MLTEPRLHYRPYEYPGLLRFRDAIRHSYWVHTEYSYTADVQDYALVEEKERSMVRRALLAIAQVELAVKLFWARLYEVFPKPEIAEVGMTFAESEVRHANAYAHLLDLLSLEGLFAKALEEETPLKERSQALAQVLSRWREGTLRAHVQALLLFSAFTEHISLFSQFYALMALNRRAGRFKGISNAIEATSKEENIHGLFGVELLRILREEEPQLFAEGFAEEVLAFAQRLYQGEEALVDWIFAAGDLEAVSRDEVVEFLKGRYNEVLSLYGLPQPFSVNPERLRDTEWFSLELLADKEVDFFNKRSVAYARRLKSYEPDELF